MHATHPLAALSIALLASSAGAATTTLAGNFGDAGNAALVGSDLSAPAFGDDGAIANNVALYTFNVVKAGEVTIASTGYAAGGAYPYFTLFDGGGSTATLLDSDWLWAVYGIPDFSWSFSLPVGTYEIALGTYLNMSFAENWGSGTLGDGFIGVGDPSQLGDGSYRLTLTTPVPEPVPALLLLAGLGGVALRRRRHRHRQAD